MKRNLSLLNGPWALHPGHVNSILSLARAAMTGQQNARAGRDTDPQTDSRVAVVPIHGELFSRSWIADFLGLPTYQRIEATMRALTQDARVEEIILSVDSPGGMALNVDEAAAAIADAAKIKPVTAVANGYMASGAYWLASQATEIVATPLSVLASIGVVTMHADYSQLLEDEGIDVKVYRTGQLKALGQLVDPNDDTMQSRNERELTDILQLFADAVATGRGMTASDVLQRFALDTDHPDALKGGTVLGAEAVRLGLADKLSTVADVTTAAISRHKTTKAQFKIGAPQKGTTMNELLARLGLEETASASEVSAALEALETQAATRTEVRIAKALNIEAATDTALANVAQEASDGRQYRADQLEELHRLTVTVEGNDTDGVEAADRAKRIFAGASIADLTAEVQRLTMKAANAVPAGRLSTDEPDESAAPAPVDYDEV